MVVFGIFFFDFIRVWRVTRFFYKFFLYLPNKIIYLFKVSNVMNYPTGWGNGIVDTASTYVRVPYVKGLHRNQYNQWVVKGLHQGYEGVDCSGLASWSYLRNDIEVNPDYSDYSSKVNNTNAQMLWQRFGAIANGYDDQE